MAKRSRRSAARVEPGPRAAEGAVTEPLRAEQIPAEPLRAAQIPAGQEKTAEPRKPQKPKAPKLDLSHIDWPRVAERFRGGAKLTVLAVSVANIIYVKFADSDQLIRGFGDNHHQLA